MTPRIFTRIIATLVLCWAGVGPARGASKSLAVPFVSQRPQNLWCWAASSQAVLSYAGNAPGMCSVADWARQQNGWGNDDCCTNGTGSICNQVNWMWGRAGSIQTILTHWGADSTSHSSALSQSDAKEAIDDDSPVVVRWGRTDGSGHFVVLYGYDDATMKVMDPWDGLTDLSYDNLRSTSTRAWTHTLVVTPKKITYVIDDTGSMWDDIASVRSTLLAHVDQLVSAGRFVKYTLITYKDYVQYRGTTVQPDEIRGWINALSADGGGDCPEDGYGALDEAAARAPHSEIWWMTDADSHGGSLRMRQTEFNLSHAGCTLHSCALGSCGSPSAASYTADTPTSTQADCVPYDGAAYRRSRPSSGAEAALAVSDLNAYEAGKALSIGTGGLFFAASGGNIGEATGIIFEEMSSTALLRRLALPAGNHEIQVPVDASISTLKITLDVAAGATGSLSVFDPSGNPVSAGAGGVTEIVADQSRMLIIPRPTLVNGLYTVSTQADDAYFLSVSATSEHWVDLVGDTTAGVGRPVQLTLSIPSLAPPTGPGGPDGGGPGVALGESPALAASLPFDPNTLKFFFEQEDGSGRTEIDLFDDGLHADANPGDGTFGGVLVLPTAGRYRLGVHDGVVFGRVTKLLLAVSDVSVTAPADVVTAPGSTITQTFSIVNLSTTSRSFAVAASSSPAWADTTGVPAVILLDPGASTMVDIPVNVPASAQRADASVLSLTAVAQDDPSTSDSAAVTTIAWIGPLFQRLSATTVRQGGTVTLIGSGFGADPGKNARDSDLYHVEIGGHRVPAAEVLEWTPTSITVRVPRDAISGLIDVVVDGMRSNELDIIVLPAERTPVTPAPSASLQGIAALVTLLLIAGRWGLTRRAGQCRKEN